MKRKHVALGLAVTLLGLVAASLTLAAGASPKRSQSQLWGRNPLTSKTAVSPASHEGGQTLVVTVREVNSQDVDVGREGPTSGDYFLFKENLFNRAGTRVGRDNVQCTTNFPFTETRFSINCMGAFTFTGAGGIRKGQIVAEGNITFTEATTRFAVPITGGTRHYQNVRGELHSGEEGQLVFHLIP